MTIKQKQWNLSYLDCYPLTIDGLWGGASRDGTVQFQREAGLEPDGIYGEKTEAAARDQIRQLQQALGISADGLAGPKTVEATAAWQRSHGLPATGRACAATRKALLEPKDWWEGLRYFTREELRCKCGGKFCDGFPAQPSLRLLALAEAVREQFSSPVLVSSCLRCRRHNAAVGGVGNSRHLSGRAMDFRVPGSSAGKVLAWVRQQPQTRYAYAIDESYVHIDVE